MNPREIIILAGGSGTRLSSVNKDLPKCLVEISGKPFLFYLIRYYLSIGLQKFIFSLGYQYLKVADFLKHSFPDLDYELVVEEEQLGTGGAALLSIKVAQDNTVLLVNGDTYFRITLSSMAGFHHMCGAECTIALKEMQDTSRYGAILLNCDYSISSFIEKGNSGAGFINGGAYILNKRMFLSHNFPDKFSFEKDYLEANLNSVRAFGVKQNGYFIDIGVPEDLERARREITAYEPGLD